MWRLAESLGRGSIPPPVPCQWRAATWFRLMAWRRKLLAEEKAALVEAFKKGFADRPALDVGHET